MVHPVPVALTSRTATTLKFNVSLVSETQKRQTTTTTNLRKTDVDVNIYRLI